MYKSRTPIIMQGRPGGSMTFLRSRFVKPIASMGWVSMLILSSVLSLAQNAVPPPRLEAPPYQWARSHNYDVQHYRIAVSFDWTAKSVSGETTITFQPQAPDFKEIELAAGEMTIKSVKTASGVELNHRYTDNEKLYVTLDRCYPEGHDVTITISYSAT